MRKVAKITQRSGTSPGRRALFSLKAERRGRETTVARNTRGRGLITGTLRLLQVLLLLVLAAAACGLPDAGPATATPTTTSSSTAQGDGRQPVPTTFAIATSGARPGWAGTAPIG